MVLSRALNSDEVAGLYADNSVKYLDVDFTELEDGNYTFRAYAQDEYGNVEYTEKRTVEAIGIEFSLDIIYPIGNVNVTQNEFFNVTVNVTCTIGNCGTINVSLDPIPEEIKELENERTYNQKVFSLDNGDTRYQMHAGHIYYVDRVSGELEDIDTDLVSAGEGWTMGKASYSLIIPEYANGSFEFTNEFEDAKGDNVDMTPVIVNNVKGILSGDNSVVYEDAFGNSIDLKVIAKNNGFDKLVVLNEKPGNLTEDLEFAFKVNLGDFDIKADGDSWDRTKDIDVNSRIVLSDSGDTFFRDFRVWDSARGSQDIRVKLAERDGEYYLIKVLNKEFLENAVYPVYTDDTLTYYVGNGDGHVYEDCTDWDNCHNSTFGYSVDSGLQVTVNSWIVDSQYYLYRSFVPIDTSGIADNSVINNANFSVYVHTIFNNYSKSMHLIETSQVSPLSLTGGDFDNVGTIEGANAINLSDINIDEYNSFALNGTGESWINKTGYTYLGIRDYFDLYDIDPYTVGNGSSGAHFDSSEWTNDPYLQVDITLDNKGLIPVGSGMPFYTNESNPRTSSTLSEGESETIVYWVNATGEVGYTYNFFAFANLTSEMSRGVMSSNWDVTIV